MEKALRGDKISYIYFVVRFVITCIGFVTIGIDLLRLDIILNSLPDKSTGNTIDGLNIFFSIIGFFIIAYCLITFAIGVVHNLVPILIGSSMKKKFIKTNNPKYIRDELMLKELFLGFEVLSNFSLIFNVISNELYTLVIGFVIVLVADIIIIIFTWLGYLDACKAFKEYKNWQYSRQSMKTYSSNINNQAFGQSYYNNINNQS